MPPAAALRPTGFKARISGVCVPGRIAWQQEASAKIGDPDDGIQTMAPRRWHPDDDIQIASDDEFGHALAKIG